MNDFRQTINGISIIHPLDDMIENAFWVSEQDNTISLATTIIDVSHYVSEESVIDQKAVACAFDEYDNNNILTRPIFDNYLRKNDLTLSKNIAKMGLTVKVYLKKGSLNINDIYVFPSKILIRDELTYKKCDDIICGVLKSDLTDSLRPELLLFKTLADSLLRKRKLKGGSAEYNIEGRFATGEEGLIYHLNDNNAYYSAIISQEFKILTNFACAIWLQNKKIHFIARNHEASYLKDGKENTISANAPQYSTDITGHYGLALPAYGTFVSPISSAPDLINQRILCSTILNQRPSLKHKYDEINLSVKCKYFNKIEKRRRKMEEITNDSSTTETPLSKLSTIDFGKVLLKSMQSGILDKDLRINYLTRLACNEIRTIDIYNVFFEAIMPEDDGSVTNWNAIVAASLNWIRTKSIAIDILLMCEKNNGWSQLVFRDSEYTNNSVTEYMSYALIHTKTIKYSGKRVLGTNKINARKNAALNLLAIILDKPLIYPEISVDEKTNEEPLLIVINGDYVETINEYAKKINVTLPKFAINEIVNKVIQVKCEAFGFTVFGKGKTVEKARQEAAMQIKQLLKQKVPF